MKRWTIYTIDGHLATEPIEVECPVGGYPNQDANGKVQFVNTHFDAKGDAWKHLLDNANAGVSLAASAVREVRSRLAKAEKELVEETLLAQAAKDNFERGRGQ